MSVIENKRISLTGNKTIFSRKFSTKKIIVLTTKKAALLRTLANQEFTIQWNPATTPRYKGKHLKAWQNYSKICGNEPRYNEYILTVPTHNVPRCNEYFVRSLAAVRVKLNDKVFFELDVLIVSALHLQFTVSNE